MIKFEEFYLENGLQVIVHEDPDSALVCMNLLYKVGSRNERPHKTGFAHLFEHLMFGGSANIPQFDTPLQMVGGDNNAFTSTDITNYYITLPAANVETAFWLESDRMLGLSFDPKVLEVQQKVVIEEFRQRYINQPYGDIWHLLRPMAYEKHAYQWPTIGSDISHIEEATMEDVKQFFYSWYVPNNAVLVLAGAIDKDKARHLAEKWFGPIPAGTTTPPNPEAEPVQQVARRKEHVADVPTSAFYKVYHMPGRMDTGYHPADLLSDVLGRGKSSLLYQQLVRQHEIFRSVSSYVTGSVDPGLLVISGKLAQGVDLEEAEQAVSRITDGILQHGVEQEDLERVKNQSEAALVYGEVELLNRAMSLAYSAFLGDTNLANEELEQIRKVGKEDIESAAASILRDENSSTLYYKAKAQ